MGTKGGLLVESTDLDKNIATGNCQVGLPPGPQGLPPLLPSTAVIVRRLNPPPGRRLCLHLVLSDPPFFFDAFPPSQLVVGLPRLRLRLHRWLHSDPEAL